VVTNITEDEHFGLGEFYKMPNNWQILMSVWMNIQPRNRKHKKRLIAYLKYAKRRGSLSFMRKDKLMVNGKIYNLDSFLKSTLLNDRNIEIYRCKINCHKTRNDSAKKWSRH